MSARTIRDLEAIERAALDHFAAEHGRRWKSVLRDVHWYNARPADHPAFPNRGAILHGLRNDPRWSFDGLEKYKAGQ